ncbi:MAG: ABC transporter ATP-binding protein [Anaerocolumna sp.]
MISVNGLSKEYTIGEVKTSALNNISLTINEGEFVAITGRSGCGKSTLLNILGGMDRQTSGSYLYEDMNVSLLRGKALAKFRNERIGFVFQSFYLINEMNAIENVAMPLGYAGINSKKRYLRASLLLEQVGLKERMKNKPSQLSGGEQQRVAIARAISNKPSILLADEPTGNLDEESSMNIMKLIKKLNNNGLTIIMVTHDLDIAAMAHRVIKMADGSII